MSDRPTVRHAEPAGLLPAALRRAARSARRLLPRARPRCGLILGSGWAPAARAFRIRAEIPFARIPGLGDTSVRGHTGTLLWAELAGVESFVFLGRHHWYEGRGWTPIAIPIHLLRVFGAEAVVLANAAGAIRRNLNPGDLMVIEDHINQMGVHPLVGPHTPDWGPRFPDMTHIYDAALSAMLRAAARDAGIRLTRGVYMAVSGPTYETPAEVRAFATAGADAVGMSTVPEAILAHAAGLRVAGLSYMANRAASRSAAPLSHQQVVAEMQRRLPAMADLLECFWTRLAAERRVTRVHRANGREARRGEQP
jgi:purine-nucleoside phosphorylase